MSTGRLEAFSDAVIAVVITIMVLDLHPPDGSSLHDLRPLVPKLSVYLLSFVFIALYWNNHHHLLRVVDHRLCLAWPRGTRQP
jgi:TMEM175 potassium channel family protein